MSDQRDPLQPLFPEVGPITADAELADTEDFIDELLTDSGLEVRSPPPVGKSYAFDWRMRRFVPANRGGVVPTFGDSTLRAWIEKALQSERYGTIIHADGGYGMEGVNSVIGESSQSDALLTLRSRIEEALLVHPSIRGIADFAYATDEERVWVQFTVLTEDEPLQIERLDVGPTDSGIM